MILVWALLLAAAAIGNSYGAVTPRILGGEPASVIDYPSAVQIEFRSVFLSWSQTCAGAIITPRFVLSVATCFTGFLFAIDQRRIRCGTTYRERGGSIVGIARANHHYSYRPNYYEGDITVLQTEYRLNFGIGINAAALPPQGFRMFDNAPVSILGWGTMQIDGGGPSSDILRRADLFTVNHNECINRYSYWPERPADVSENMLCTALLDVSERDACDGDAGGPVYFNRDILVGIISWGAPCGNAYFPRVNTKVSNYINWIHEVIGPGDWCAVRWTSNDSKIGEPNNDYASILP